MKLELTQKEYRLLLDILHIAEWIMNSYVIDDRPETEKYRRLEQKILSYADEMGCKGVVDYDKELGGYFPTREIEEGSAMDFIDEYNEDTFWEELVSHLAERDFINRSPCIASSSFLDLVWQAPSANVVVFMKRGT